MKTLLLFTLGCAGLWGQSCTLSVASPIQTSAPVTVTPVLSGAPTAFRSVLYVDWVRRGQMANIDLHIPGLDPWERWAGTPYGVVWYPGLDGDGTHTLRTDIYAFGKHVGFDAPLASCSATVVVRLQGLSATSLTSPGSTVSGQSTLTPAYPLSGFTFSAAVDGQAVPVECGRNNLVTQWTTTCYFNGDHLVMGGGMSQGGTEADPYVVAQTISSVASGNEIVFPSSNDGFQTNRPVVFTSGTPPSPLTNGCAYYWYASTTDTSQNSGNTATLSISGGVITVSLSSSCSYATTGTPVWLQGIPYTSSGPAATNACDGWGTILSGSGGSSFTVTAPSGCPNSISVSGCTATSNCDLEVVVNPYFLGWVDSTHATLASFPGGSPISLTCSSCSGKIVTRVNSPFYADTGGPDTGQVFMDWLQGGPPTHAWVLTDIENGTKPAQIQIPYRELHGWTGKSGDTVCPTGVTNTDKTLTSEPCSYFTYTVNSTYGVTGAISVNSSTGAVTYNSVSSWSCTAVPCNFNTWPPASNGWAQVTVSCPTCNYYGGALPAQTVMIEDHGDTQASVKFPSYSSCGVVAASFDSGLPSGCHSEMLNSVEQFNGGVQNAWNAPSFQHSGVNAVFWGPGTADDTGLISPASGSCPSWSSQSDFNTLKSWMTTNNIGVELDMYNLWTANLSNMAGLAAILNNTGYNRQSCLQGFMSYWQATGLVPKLANDDEVNDFLGLDLNYDGGIAGGNSPAAGNRFISATCTSGVLTVTYQGLELSAWNQSTGQGSYMFVTGSTNGWNGIYLLSSVGSTTFTAPAPGGSCPASTITGTTDPNMSITWPFPQLANPNPAWQNAGPLPWNLSGVDQALSSTTYVTVSGSTGTLHCSTDCGTGIGNYLTTSSKIHIWSGTTTGLNIIAQITAVPDANDVQFTYPGTTGGVAPTCTGTSSECNSTTDPNAFFTVDPAWGQNPLKQFFTIAQGITNPPVNVWSILGTTFGVPATVIDFEGTPANSGGTFIYPQGAPGANLGYDSTIDGWVQNAAYPLGARPYWQSPSIALIVGGFIGNEATIGMCRSFVPNWACDRPTLNIYVRPEGKSASYVWYAFNGGGGGRLYNQYDVPAVGYNLFCCGWNNRANWGGIEMNPFVGHDIWEAYAQTQDMYHALEDVQLQPETDKPYLTPFLYTDAHLGSYGNLTGVLNSAEIPQGNFTLPLNPISGGSTVEYLDDGYSIYLLAVSGNPASVTQEFAQAPGLATMFVSLPPGSTRIDYHNFAPPSPLPFGAAEMWVLTGYYPDDFRDAQAINCTSGCTVMTDHHRNNEYFEIVYANSNGQPVSIGTAQLLASQGQE